MGAIIPEGRHRVPNDPAGVLVQITVCEMLWHLEPVPLFIVAIFYKIVMGQKKYVRRIC